jgi:predicted Zn-dependent protease
MHSCESGYGCPKRGQILSLSNPGYIEMSGLFYNLGRLAGPKIRTAKWAYLSATAPEAEVIEAEYAAGSDMAQQIYKQCTVCSDIALKLKKIANPLIQSLKNNRRTFSYEAIRASEPQAFCLPGGFVFVSDTMVEQCGGSTDQLAFIMAHEMAHVIQGHVMERMLASALIRTIMRGGHLRAATMGSLGQLGTRFLERAYSREDEYKADTFAVRLASAAGYNPAGAIDLFLRLEPLQTGQLLGPYFSTHPSFKARIQNIQDVIKEMTR